MAVIEEGRMEAVVVEQVVAIVATDAETSMGDRRTRHLVDRFWDLDASDRREIALELDLITKEEIQLPETQRYGVALIRAAARKSKARAQARRLLSARAHHLHWHARLGARVLTNGTWYKWSSSFWTGLGTMHGTGKRAVASRC